MKEGDKVPRMPKAHRVEVDDHLKDAPVSGHRPIDRPGVHRDRMGQPTEFQQGVNLTREQAKHAQIRARKIIEFAKLVPYSYAEAREACGPDATQEYILACWADFRWSLAKAMVDNEPDFGINLEASA